MYVVEGSIGGSGGVGGYLKIRTAHRSAYQMKRRNQEKTKTINTNNPQKNKKHSCFFVVYEFLK